MEARPNKYLTFVLAGEEYGVDISTVQEIVVMLPITPMPDAPPGIVGAVSLRGSVIPVLDMRVRLGLPTLATPSRDAVVVVARIRGLRVGLVVDRVLEVTEVSAMSIEPVPAFGNAVASHLIRGLVTTAGRVRILLEIEAVLSGTFALGAAA
jgi:purine-binding chemotaxis protein CheW